MHDYLDVLVAFRQGYGSSCKDGDSVDLAGREGEHVGENGSADEASGAGEDEMHFVRYSAAMKLLIQTTEIGVDRVG